MKVFGKDLYESQKLAVQIDKILGTVEGIEDLGVIRNIGQPELRIELDEQKLARYGVAKEDVQSIIEMAIGGKSASLLYEDERKFNIMVRYNPEFRQNEDQIGKILGTVEGIEDLGVIRNIGQPELRIELDEQNEADATKFGMEINDHNNERKNIDREITKEAVEIVKKEHDFDKLNSTVVYNEGWHKGVVGIVASRLVEAFYRPTIVLTKSSNGFVTGSARSMPGLNQHPFVHLIEF